MMQQRVDNLIQLGIDKYQLGQYKSAYRDCFDHAIALDSQNSRAWYYRGLALFELGYYRTASISYRKALRFQKDNSNILYNLGNSYYQLGWLEDARKAYNEAIILNPECEQIKYKQSLVLSEICSKTELTTIGNKTFPEAAFQETTVEKDELDSNKLKTRLIKHEKAIIANSRKTEHFDKYIKCLRLLLHFKEYKEVIVSTEKLINLAQGSCLFWYLRGEAIIKSRLDNNFYEEAIECYEKALTIKPRDNGNWQQYSQLSLSLFNWKVESTIRNAIQTAVIDSSDRVQTIEHVDRSQAWFHKGELLTELGNYQKAIEYYIKALEEKPNIRYIQEKCSKAFAVVIKKTSSNKILNIKDVLDKIEQALQNKPENYNVWLMICTFCGSQLWKIHKLRTEAIACYHKALQLEKNENSENSTRNRFDDFTIWNKIGRIKLELEDYDDSEVAHRAALAVGKNKDEFATALYGIGKALFGLEKYREASQAYEEALKYKPLNWLYWKHRGEAVYKFSGIDGELKIYKQGIEAFWKEKEIDKKLKDEGIARLFYVKGKAQQKEGLLFPAQEEKYWSESIKNYRKALKKIEEYSDDDTSLFRIEILYGLIKVHESADEISEFVKCSKEALRILDSLIEEFLQKTYHNKRVKNLLAKKFYLLDTLRIHVYAKEGDWRLALECAERRKNICLKMLKNDKDKRSSTELTSDKIWELTNKRTAVIYWHINQFSITTFILTNSDICPQVLHPDFQYKSDYQKSKNRLEKIKTLMEVWKIDYENYRQARRHKHREPELFQIAENKWQETIKSSIQGEQGFKEILEINKIECKLKGYTDINQLILIPHRDLHLLPLHALFSEKYTITYLPSAQIGLQLEPIPDPEHRLLIVNPPGEELLSALESAAISQFYPPERHQELREDKATHLEVIQTLQNDVSFSYFHFIGHAEHNFNNPKISALQLSNRKRLTLAYINKQSLDLSNYYLVCLPACETGLTGNASEIEEYVGLVSAFLAKGASYVISTLWKVDSQCTALAMIEFYQCLTREPNMNPITALKKVQHWLKDITYDKLQQWLLNLASEFPEDSRERESIEKLAKEAKEQANKVQPNYRPYKDPYWWASFKISGKTPIDI